MLRKLCCAYDGSPGATVALNLAIHLAQTQVVPLHLVIVQEPPPGYVESLDEPQINADLEAHYAARARELAKHLAQAHGLAVTTTICAGPPAPCIVRFLADGGFDLLVIGRTTHSDLWCRLLGTTLDDVIHHAPCAVLVAGPGPT